jgi:predicted peptidase
MDRKPRRFDGIDWLLIAAIVGLSAFLIAEIAPPLFDAWQNRPRRGVQVRQQCLVQENGGSNGAIDGGGQGKNEASKATMSVNYLLYLPREYRQDKKWPLLVYLHGSGQRGNDLERVRRASLPMLLEPDRALPGDSAILDQFIIISPQCPTDAGWVPEQVIALIEQVGKSFPVDQERVYLTGFSMGGFGTWATACQYPERFAAIVPLAGGGDVNLADRLKDTPIWAFHGAKDETVPLGSDQAMVDAVRKCGGKVEFTVYPEARHGIAIETYQNPELYQWLLAQRRSQQPLASQSRNQTLRNPEK